jgi:hypothetical protein
MPQSTATRYKAVSGSWTVPQGSCTAGEANYSAAWVGLGGYRQSSKALEQTGTELDCSSAGTPVYYAWYELVPSPGKRIHMTVKPGDTIDAAVRVTGTKVRITLSDTTRGETFDHTYKMSSPSVDSAEWIVEAPASCNSSGACAQLPLANFGSLSFGHASATTTKGYRGAVGDPRWSATAVTLAGDDGRPFRYRYAAGSALGGATPSPLGSDSGSFTISYLQQAPPPAAATPPA